jgi:uncharacterized protein (DUF305 family)
MRRTAIMVALLVMLAGCSAGGGTHPRPATRPASAYHMLSPVAYQPLDLEFASELYVYSGLALQLVRQARADSLGPVIRQFDHGMAEVQAGYAQELSGWLRQWNQPLPDVDAPPRVFASELSLTSGDVSELGTFSGPEYAVKFLDALISDEQGALRIATAEQEGGGYGPGRQLATEVVAGSTATIVTIRSMLHQITPAAGLFPVSLPGRTGGSLRHRHMDANVSHYHLVHVHRRSAGDRFRPGA